MKKWLVLTSLCLVAVTAKAEEKSIASRLFGVSPGMTYDEVHAIHKSLPTPVGWDFKDEKGTVSNTSNEDIGGVQFEILFRFGEESKKLIDISASFPSDDFELIAQALTAKYGEGIISRNIVASYTIAGIYGQTEYYWLSPGCIILARRYKLEHDSLIRGVHSVNPAKSYIGLFENRNIGKAKENKPKSVDDLIKGL